MGWHRPWARSPSRAPRAVPTYSYGSDVISPLTQEAVLLSREYATACLHNLWGGQGGIDGTRRCGLCDEGQRSPRASG
eukprot:2891177-Pyramimonas_sp.AAC.1